MRQLFWIVNCELGILVFSQPALGNAVTNGVNGINVPAVALTGDGVGLGQVEPGRPGLAGVDAPANIHMSVVPAAVFRRDGGPNIADVDDHAEQVAGIMISTDVVLAGVAPHASLYAPPM